MRHEQSIGKFRIDRSSAPVELLFEQQIVAVRIGLIIFMYGALKARTPRKRVAVHRTAITDT
jgi:hypothetical protein